MGYRAAGLIPSRERCVMRNIIFVGFMGAGKTTVGRKVANTLGRDFWDMDKILIERYGPIGDIFRKHGEPYFRKAERELFRELLAAGGVISTGGGTLATDENAELLELLDSKNIVIWLAVDYNVAVKRVKSDLKNMDRPNADADMFKRFTERQDRYNNISGIVVDANFSFESVIHDVFQALKMA